MRTLSLTRRRRLCGAALVVAAVACNGSDVTSPSIGSLRATPVTSGPPATLLTLTGRIAFASSRAGASEIYVMNANGTGVTRLTRNSGYDLHPAWSRDGKKLAFVSDIAGNDEIYLINADGTGLTRLTNNPASDEGPVWSPNGSKIAFYSNRLDRHFEIYVMNANGSGVTRLTKNLPSGCTHSPWCDKEIFPAWSPDGTKIAFDHRINDFGGAIDIMNANGSGITRLTAPGWGRLDWSRNGKIVFNRFSEIAVVTVSGAVVTRLTNNTALDEYPAWSPDGSKIVFDSDRSGNFEIYAMNANGTGVTRLTNNSAFDGLPAWGP